MQEAGIETRNSQDTPLSERDCEVFSDFYYDFLGKTEVNKIDLLKGLSMLRQGQRRPFIHALMAEREFAETLFPTQEERELLLAFPSTLESLLNVIVDYSSQYGREEEAVASMRNWLGEQLTEIKRVRDEFGNILTPLRPIPPKDKFELSMTFANTGTLKPRAQASYKVLLIVLASRPFLCILSEDTPSTMALGKLRSYMDRTLGQTLENMQIEFFTIGGARMHKTEKVKLEGSNPIFDLVFEKESAPASAMLMKLYQDIKYEVMRDILREEFPTEIFDWEVED